MKMRDEYENRAGRKYISSRCWISDKYNFKIDGEIWT